MNILTTILVLFVIDAIDTKSFKAYNDLPDDAEGEKLAKQRKLTPKRTNVAGNEYELLGLLIFDEELITRRTFDEADLLKSKEESSEDELEQRTHGKRKKKRFDKSKDKTLGLDLEADTEDDATEMLQGPDPISDDPIVMTSPLRTACLRESSKGIDKCIRACNRSHEDVCDRLACSNRSKRALRKECEFNCKKVFNPRLCY